jgi:hypothetical protein
LALSGRADLLRSSPLSGVKRTSRLDRAASAFDPKRTWGVCRYMDAWRIAANIAKLPDLLHKAAK